MEPNTIVTDNNINQNLNPNQNQNYYPNFDNNPQAQPIPQPIYEPPPSAPLMGGPQYGQPVVTPAVQVVQVQPSIVQVQPPIVVNQENPVVVLSQDMFKSTSLFMVCPYCERNINTSIKETFNCATLLLCLFCTPLLYVIIQCLRKKDICCFDVDHRCPYCNNRLGSYSSC